jgi:hypothetical protein
MLYVVFTLCYIMGMSHTDRDNPHANDSSVLYIRDVPPHLKRRLRAAAALAGYRGLPSYVIEVLQKHVEELEKKGALPKSK